MANQKQSKADRKLQAKIEAEKRKWYKEEVKLANNVLDVTKQLMKSGEDEITIKKKINDLESEHGDLTKKILKDKKNLNGAISQNAGAAERMLETIQQQSIDGALTNQQMKDQTKVVSDLANGQLDLAKIKEYENSLGAEMTDEMRSFLDLQKKRITAENQAVSGWENLNNLTGGYADKIKEAGASMKNGMGLLMVQAAIVAALVKAFSSVSETIDKIGDSLGTFGTGEMRDDIMMASAQAQKFGMGMDDVLGSANELQDSFGMSYQDAIAMSGQVTNMSKALGVSTTEGAQLMGIFSTIGGLTPDMAEDLITVTKELAEASGVAPSAVMKDVASNTEAFARFGKDGGANMMKAAVQAKKLGTDLGKVAGIMDSMLDFETSVNAEMEASMMIGRQLNYQKARELALNNDIEGAMSEIVSQVGSQAEFDKLNALQRKALADSIGVSTDEMAKFVANQDKAGKSSEDLANQKPFDELVGQDAMSDLTEMMNGLKSIGAVLTTVLAPILNGIVKPLSAMISFFAEWGMAAKVTAGIMAAVLLPTLAKYLVTQKAVIVTQLTTIGGFLKTTAVMLANNIAWVAMNAAQAVYNIVSPIATLMTTGFSIALNTTGIPLIVIAVGALIAGIVLLFKKLSGGMKITEMLGAGLKMAFFPIIQVVKLLKIGFEALMPVFLKIKEIAGMVFGWIGSFIGDTFGFISDIFMGIFDAIYGVFDFVMSIIKGALNIIIKGINFLIDGINLFSIDIPNWVPVVGGKTFGFDIPNIPELEQGGEVTQTGIAKVDKGEIVSGTKGEAMAPVSDAIMTLKEELMALRNEMKGYMGPTGTLAGSIGSQTVNALEKSQG